MKKNYRIAIREFEGWIPPIKKSFDYSLKEVYYNGRGEIIYALDVFTLSLNSRESLQDIKKEVLKINKAFNKKPIYYDLKAKQWIEKKTKS
jgi:hypothetical protein